MKKRRLFILSSSVVCVVIIAVGLLHWHSEQVAEQKLQRYIRNLERMGCIVEERPLSDFRVDHIQKDTFWNDFSLEVDYQVNYQDLDHVYYDRGKHLLYFIRPNQGNGVEVEAFSYKWKISDLFD